MVCPRVHVPEASWADQLVVIKLKQVEHVRNERNVLAAVAGYPFITTLITSFSDATSLYMLVCERSSDRPALRRDIVGCICFLFHTTSMPI